MARTYLVFGDIEGKLDVLRVECTKCDRNGRYHVHKLIEKYGSNGNMTVWRDMLNGDKRDGRLHDRCDWTNAVNDSTLARADPYIWACGVGASILSIGHVTKAHPGAPGPILGAQPRPALSRRQLRAVGRTPSPIDAGRIRLCWPLR
jgi:hypothetical protein